MTSKFEYSERTYKGRMKLLWFPGLLAATGFILILLDSAGIHTIDRGLLGPIVVLCAVATVLMCWLIPRPLCPKCRRNSYAVPCEFCPLCGAQCEIEHRLIAADRCRACTKELTRQKSEPAYEVHFCTHCGEKLR